MRLEYWTGANRWQGEWRPLPAQVRAEGDRVVWTPDWQGNRQAAAGVSKVRLILAAGSRSARVRLHARTPTPVEEAVVRLECDRPRPGQGWLRIYNGEIADTPPGPEGRLAWVWPKPLEVRVRYHRPGAPGDRTVLQVEVPGGGFGIAMDDLLREGCVYVKALNVFASLPGRGITLQGYRRRLAGCQTVRERVRRRPEQTLARALARTHHAIQDNGPMMLSLACHNAKLIVEREGSIQAPGLQMQVRYGQGPPERVERSLEGGWYPMPTSTITSGGVQYRQCTYVAPYDQASAADDPCPPGRALGVMELSLVGSRRPAAVTLGLRDPEGKPLLVQAQVGPGHINYVAGDRLLAVVDTQRLGSLRVSAESGNLRLKGELAGEAQLTTYLPAWPATAAEAAEVLARAEETSYREACRRHWESQVRCRILLPEARLQDLIMASQVHCLVAARNEGEGRHIAAWIAAATYGPLESEANSVIWGMDLWGHREFAERAFDYFIARYSPSGYLTTGYTLMGTGWHLWTLGRHVSLHGPPARRWLAGQADRVVQACRWVVRQRAKTADLAGMPEQGLMPPGVMADWEAYAPYFCLNGYYFAGLAAAAEALQAIGRPEGAELATEAERFRRYIAQAYRETQAWMPVTPCQDGTWVPGSPSQAGLPGPTGDYFPGEDGNRSWCYDVELGAHHLAAQGVLDPCSRQVDWMLEHLEDVQFLAEGWFDYPAEASRRDWFDLGGFAKVQPYYCRAGQLYARRDEVKPFLRTYFNGLASLLNTETCYLWEHFRNTGAWNKTHETGYFLEQSRLMLLQERGQELWLAPLVPSAWFGEGKVMEVRDMPSSLGPVSYRMETRGGETRATVQAGGAGWVVLRVRRPGGEPLRSVLLNGQPWTEFDPVQGIIRFRPRAHGDEVRVRF